MKMKMKIITLASIVCIGLISCSHEEDAFIIQKEFSDY